MIIIQNVRLDNNISSIRKSQARHNVNSANQVLQFHPEKIVLDLIMLNFLKRNVISSAVLLFNSRLDSAIIIHRGKSDFSATDWNIHEQTRNLHISGISILREPKFSSQSSRKIESAKVMTRFYTSQLSLIKRLAAEAGINDDVFNERIMTKLSNVYKHRQTAAVVTFDTMYYLAEKDTWEQIYETYSVIPQLILNTHPGTFFSP